MAFLPVPFSELSADEQAVVERLAGRRVGANDIVDLRIHPDSSDAGGDGDRAAATRQLFEAMDAMTAGVRPDVDPAELEAAIDEACYEARHRRR